MSLTRNVFENLVNTLSSECLLAFLCILIDVLPFGHQLQGNTLDVGLVASTTTVTGALLGGCRVVCLLHIYLVSSLTDHLTLAQVVHMLQSLPRLTL